MAALPLNFAARHDVFRMLQRRSGIQFVPARGDTGLSISFGSMQASCSGVLLSSPCPRQPMLRDLGLGLAQHLFPLIGRTQFCDVEFLHPEHGAHCPPRLRLVGITHHLRQGGWKHLPRNAVLILEPTALLDFATGGESLPVVVDLFLRLAWNLEGDRLVELEVGPPLSAVKFWPSISNSTVITDPSGRPWISKPSLP